MCPSEPLATALQRVQLSLIPLCYTADLMIARQFQNPLSANNASSHCAGQQRLHMMCKRELQSSYLRSHFIIAICMHDLTQRRVFRDAIVEAFSRELLEQACRTGLHAAILRSIACRTAPIRCTCFSIKLTIITNMIPVIPDHLANTYPIPHETWITCSRRSILGLPMLCSQLNMKV